METEGLHCLLFIKGFCSLNNPIVSFLKLFSQQNFQGCITVYLSRFCLLVSFATASIVYQNCFILSSTFLFYFLSFVMCRSVRVHLSATKAIISLCPLSVNRKLYLFSHIFIFPQKPHNSCSDKSCTLCFYLKLYELCIIFILKSLIACQHLFQVCIF